MHTNICTISLYSFELESLSLEQGSFLCGNNGRLQVNI